MNYISDVMNRRVGVCEPILTHRLFMDTMQRVLLCVSQEQMDAGTFRLLFPKEGSEKVINTLRTGSFKLFKRPFPGFLTFLTL